ncbi:unnamed protein product [Arabidopsis thaliana]|uniref:Uncharacterized protein n=1 Tax=Arabidopsis thaliana TaxID=3702 RepID=A0A654EI46_ARATH|nr:unnamed protein product [Arabidopsis thaliana]
MLAVREAEAFWTQDDHLIFPRHYFLLRVYEEMRERPMRPSHLQEREEEAERSQGRSHENKAEDLLIKR